MKTTNERVPQVYIIRGHGKKYDTNVNIMKRGIYVEKVPELFQCFSPIVIQTFAQGGITHVWATHELGPVPLYGDVFIFSRYREKYVIDFIGVSSGDKRCPEVARRVFLNSTGIWEYIFLLKPIELTHTEKEEIGKTLYRLSWKYLNDPLRRWSCSEGIPLSLFIGNLETKGTAMKIVRESTMIREKLKHY